MIKFVVKDEVDVAIAFPLIEQSAEKKAVDIASLGCIEIWMRTRVETYHSIL